MNELLERFYAHQKKIQLSATIWNVVANDQNNRMPSAAQSTRADQLAHINGRIYELSNSPEYVTIVQELSKNKEGLSRKDIRSLFLAGVNEVVQYHSTEFLAKFDTTKNKALAQRHKAKEKNDRAVLAPALADSFTMAAEYARLYNDQIHPLSVWADYSEYMMNQEKYDELFTPLAQVCNEIISKSVKKEKDTSLFITDYDGDTLLELLHELLGKIGFDFQQGTLSAIKRPYSENCGPGDERIHIGAGKGLLETILAGLHECGHGLTDMHINPDYHRTNLHRSLSMGVHESQARGLENMIGRSQPFCIYLATLLNKYFPSHRNRNAEELYEYLNHIQPSVNRVTADEVSYNLHIIIRFQLEKEIFSGTLALKDLPSRWNELYEQHMGVKITNNNEGALQDQHWSLGLFGYFPTYALGNIISGQLRASFVSAHPTWSEEISQGNFSSYFSRHKTNIRRHGNLDTTSEILMRVTGSELRADFFIDYLTKKYLGV